MPKHKRLSTNILIIFLCTFLVTILMLTINAKNNGINRQEQTILNSELQQKVLPSTDESEKSIQRDVIAVDKINTNSITGKIEQLLPTRDGIYTQIDNNLYYYSTTNKQQNRKTIAENVESVWVSPGTNNAIIFTLKKEIFFVHNVDQDTGVKLYEVNINYNTSLKYINKLEIIFNTNNETSNAVDVSFIVIPYFKSQNSTEWSVEWFEFTINYINSNKNTDLNIKQINHKLITSIPAISINPRQIYKIENSGYLLIYKTNIDDKRYELTFTFIDKTRRLTTLLRNNNDYDDYIIDITLIKNKIYVVTRSSIYVFENINNNIHDRPIFKSHIIDKNKISVKYKLDDAKANTNININFLAIMEVNNKIFTVIRTLGLFELDENDYSIKNVVNLTKEFGQHGHKIEYISKNNKLTATSIVVLGAKCIDNKLILLVRGISGNYLLIVDTTKLTNSKEHPNQNYIQNIWQIDYNTSGIIDFQIINNNNLIIYYYPLSRISQSSRSISFLQITNIENNNLKSSTLATNQFNSNEEIKLPIVVKNNSFYFSTQSKINGEQNIFQSSKINGNSKTHENKEKPIIVDSTPQTKTKITATAVDSTIDHQIDTTNPANNMNEEFTVDKGKSMDQTKTVPQITTSDKQPPTPTPISTSSPATTEVEPKPAEVEPKPAEVKPEPEVKPKNTTFRSTESLPPNNEKTNPLAKVNNKPKQLPVNKPTKTIDSSMEQTVVPETIVPETTITSDEKPAMSPRPPQQPEEAKPTSELKPEIEPENTITGNDSTSEKEADNTIEPTRPNSPTNADNFANNKALTISLAILIPLSIASIISGLLIYRYYLKKQNKTIPEN